MAIKSVNSKITKIITADIKVPEDTKNGSILGTYSGKCCDSTVFNNNEMKLDRELFETLFNSEEYKRAMEYGHYLGFLGHPEDPGCQDYKNCCIVMRDCNIASNGDIEGTFDVLNTPVGQIVKTLEDAGVQLGISIRGAGDVDAEGNVDPETFVFRGFDLVTFPAYDDAIPTFQELAASSDIEKQVAYKKICSTINKNIDHISITAAEELQKNFNKDSDEYKKLEARKAELGISDEDLEVTEEDKLEVIGKKLECMTELYMNSCQETDKLKKDLKDSQDEMEKVRAYTERKLKHLERITASQQKLMQQRIVATAERCKIAISANTQLKKQLTDSKTRLQNVITANSSLTKELNSLKNSNLIYQQKIECSAADIEDKTATISTLQNKLDKTVMASTEASRKASNRDEEVKRLRSEISASTQTLSDLQDQISEMNDMLYQYQQAYAGIYASAIGGSTEGVSVTASTSVQDLENLIQGSTNTSNIMSNPDFIDDYLDPVDVINEDDDFGADLVTL